MYSTGVVFVGFITGLIIGGFMGFVWASLFKVARDDKGGESDA